MAAGLILSFTGVQLGAKPAENAPVEVREPIGSHA
jgi:hypothetical protein